MGEGITQKIRGGDSMSSPRTFFNFDIAESQNRLFAITTHTDWLNYGYYFITIGIKIRKVVITLIP